MAYNRNAQISVSALIHKSSQLCCWQVLDGDDWRLQVPLVMSLIRLICMLIVFSCYVSLHEVSPPSGRRTAICILMAHMTGDGHTALDYRRKSLLWLIVVFLSVLLLEQTNTRFAERKIKKGHLLPHWLASGGSFVWGHFSLVSTGSTGLNLYPTCSSPFAERHNKVLPGMTFSLSRHPSSTAR